MGQNKHSKERKKKEKKMSNKLIAAQFLITVGGFTTMGISLQSMVVKKSDALIPDEGLRFSALGLGIGAALAGCCSFLRTHAARERQEAALARQNAEEPVTVIVADDQPEPIVERPVVASSVFNEVANTAENPLYNVRRLAARSETIEERRLAEDNSVQPAVAASAWLLILIVFAVFI